MDFGYVLGELERGKGTQFDPKFVDILLGLIHDGTIDLNEIYHVPQKEESPENNQKQGEKDGGGKTEDTEFSERSNSERGGNA